MTSATPWPAGPAQRYCSQECRREAERRRREGMG